MSAHAFSWTFSPAFDTAPVITSGARPHFGFPFWLGSVADVVTVPTVPVVPDRWTTLAAPSVGWMQVGAVRHGFDRIYTQPRGTFGQSINFAYRISSQFPFIITANAQVLITSTITNP